MIVVVVFFLYGIPRYDSNNLHLTHLKAKPGELFIADGIDIKNYTESDEWDIVGFTARLSSEPPNRDNFYAGIAIRKFWKSNILISYYLWRHKILFNLATQSAFLHGQSNNTVREHVIFDRSSISTFVWIRRKNNSMYINLARVDSLLSTTFRYNATNFTRYSILSEWTLKSQSFKTIYLNLVVPLLGKYLVFTITMVSLSICSTIYILNIHHR